MTKIAQHLQSLAGMPLSVIVRTDDEHHAWKIINNSIKGGIKFVEITLTVPNALKLIAKTRATFPEVVVGAGTVLTKAQADVALAQGAQYLVSPVYNEELLIWSQQQDILYIPGVMTANEMYIAYHNGARLIKLFPATLISPEILKLIAKPFPDFKILATGGMNLDNIAAYFEAGVAAVGITDALGGADQSASDSEIRTLAEKYVAKVNMIIKKAVQ